MPTVRELHHEAMVFAQDAYLARDRGDMEASKHFAALALPLEIEACELVPKEPESEPTRGILYLSAASLAWQAGDLEQMMTLALEGLDGSPSGRIALNLQQLIDGELP